MDFDITSRHSGICIGLCLYRRFAIRRAGTGLAAGKLWLAKQTGLLVPGNSLARWCRCHAHTRPLPLRLRTHPGGVSGAIDHADRSGAEYGTQAPKCICTSFASTRAPGNRSGCRTCINGDSCRLRHGFIFWRADLHHRHFQCVVLAGRPYRSGQAGGDFDRLCYSRDVARTLGATARTLPSKCRSSPHTCAAKRHQSVAGHVALRLADRGWLCNSRAHSAKAGTHRGRRTIRRAFYQACSEQFRHRRHHGNDRGVAGAHACLSGTIIR